MRSSNTLLILCWLCMTLLLACSPDRKALNWLQKTERNWNYLENKQPEWPEMLDSAALQKRLLFLSEAIARAEAWKKQKLETAVNTRLTTLGSDLKAARDHLANQQKDASAYNIGQRLSRIFPPERPLETSQLEILEQYLDQTPIYYRQAKQKLEAPDPSQCDSAIAQHIRSITYLREELTTKIAAGGTPDLMIQQLNKKISNSCFYMKDYLAWCRSMAFEARN